MKIIRPLSVCSILLLLSGFGMLKAQEIKPMEVKEIMEKVANWQIQHFQDVNSKGLKNHHPLAWPNSALYIGLLKWAKIADENKYFEWLKDVGERNKWKLHKRMYHADDHAVAQLYLELYRKYGLNKMIKPTVKQFDFILFHPAMTSLKWRTPYHQDRWNWCDALFMSPPVWAKLYNITSEQKYLDFLMNEYTATVNFLFDDKESLFYRDESYMSKRDNGTKIFWSRGNGWVFAGLVHIMNELDSKSKEYKYFLNIFQKMAHRLLELQTPKGHWAMSLLGQEFYPTPETSGSSFYVYGLTWGVNNEILDRQTFEPAIKKGWTNLVGHVTEEGMLGYVQPIGAAPGNAWADKTEVYGTGAFLCAGAEVYELYSK
ncbi:glycoside hydrolase family 88/105 protein [Flagellimonas allohymeniacidonis]|uniref:Glycoside hydrolase family 88 protein n=1 Tax=Flagellimonas allohymeniacidonis TaxID=2517819 RepID=A0A4Q8QGN0_9FLAO|nr:glycoside hydrolase family 88 protein [Allomuricauda hymeniacidonis]TAI47539.1 glycoside hydrolase family 88 protein [Allomuricauda hymeniacidonis]